MGIAKKAILRKPKGFDKKNPVCLSTPDKVKRGNKERSENSKDKLVDIFEVETANETMDKAQRLVVPNMLFGELIFEKEMTILFSSAGIGKTMLAVQIADHISRGKSFGNMLNEAKAQSVLFFDLELTKKQFQGRYCVRDLNNSKIPWTNNYAWHDNFHRAQFNSAFFKQKNVDRVEAVYNGIVKWVEKTKATVIFIDNISWLTTRGLEASKDAGELMSRLDDLKKEKELAIIVMAHTPKKFKFTPMQMNDLAGSAAIQNFVDSIFAINRSVMDVDYRYLIQLKSRSSEGAYHDSNVLTLQKKHVKPNFMGFEIIEADDDNRIETNHLATQDAPSTKIVSQDVIAERTNKAFDFVSDDPEISLRTLAKAIGCGKDAASNYKSNALAKIEAQKGVSPLSGVDRQTSNKELFNNEGK